MAKAEVPRYVKVEEVLLEHPFPRCCTTGCGDKIKPLESGATCLKITWETGNVSYVEWGCLDWFVNGHPDYGHGYGQILEIIGENQIQLLACPYEDREILACIQAGLDTGEV